MDILLADIEGYIANKSIRVEELIADAHAIYDVLGYTTGQLELLPKADRDPLVQKASQLASHLRELRHECFGWKAQIAIENEHPDWQLHHDAATGAGSIPNIIPAAWPIAIIQEAVIKELTKRDLYNLKPDFLALEHPMKIHIFDWKSIKMHENAEATYDKYQKVADIFRNFAAEVDVIVVNYEPDTNLLHYWPANANIPALDQQIYRDATLQRLVRQITEYARKIDQIYSKFPGYNTSLYSIPFPTNTDYYQCSEVDNYLMKCPIHVLMTRVHLEYNAALRTNLHTLSEIQPLLDIINLREGTQHTLESFDAWYSDYKKNSLKMTPLELHPTASKKITFLSKNEDELSQLILSTPEIIQATQHKATNYFDTKVNFHIPVIPPVLSGYSVDQTVKDFCDCAETILTSRFSNGIYINKPIKRTLADHKSYLRDLFRSIINHQKNDPQNHSQYVPNGSLTGMAYWINRFLHVSEDTHIEPAILLDPLASHPSSVKDDSEAFIVDGTFNNFEDDLMQGVQKIINLKVPYEDNVKKELQKPFLEKVSGLNIALQEKQRVNKYLSDYSDSALYRIAEYVSAFAHGITISSKFTHDGIRVLTSKTNNLICIQARGSNLSNTGTAAFQFFAIVQNNDFPLVLKANRREIHSWTQGMFQTLIEFMPMRLDSARLNQLTKCFSNTMNLEARNNALYCNHDSDQTYDPFTLFYTLSCTLSKTGIFDPIKHIFGCCIAQESDLRNFLSEKYRYTVQSLTDWVLWKHVNKILQQVSELSANVDISEYYIEGDLIEDMGAKIKNPINDFLHSSATTKQIVHLINSMLMSVYLMPKGLQSHLPNMIELSSVPAEMEQPLQDIKDRVGSGNADFVVELMHLPKGHKYYYDYEELNKILNWYLDADWSKVSRIRQIVDKDGDLNNSVFTIKTMTSSHSTIDTSTKHNNMLTILPIQQGMSGVTYVNFMMADVKSIPSMVATVQHFRVQTTNDQYNAAHLEIQRLLHSKKEVAEKWGEAAYITLQRCFLGQLTLKKLSKMMSSVANNPRVIKWFKDSGIDAKFLETNSVRNELYNLIIELQFDDEDAPTVVDLINRLNPQHPKMKLFAKKQRSLKDREIYICDIVTKIHLFYTESFFRAACQVEESEAITQPGDQKVQRMFEMARSHIVRAGKYKKATNRKMDIIDLTGDCSKYSANDNMAKFFQIVMAVPWLSKNEKSRILAFLIKMCKKHLHLDMDVLAKLIQNRQKRGHDPTDPFNILADGDDKIITNIIEMTSNWGQGNFNAMSSYAHTIAFEAFRFKISNLATEKGVIDFKISGAVHSDDFWMVCSGDFTDASVTIEDFRAAFFDMLQECYDAICIKINSKKSFLSDIYFEFVSKANCYGEQIPDYASCIIAATGECAHSGPVEDMLSLGAHIQNAAQRNAPVCLLLTMQYSMQYQVLLNYNKLPGMKNSRQKTRLAEYDPTQLPLCLDGIICLEPALIAYGGVAISDCKLFFQQLVNMSKRAGIFDEYKNSPLNKDHLDKLVREIKHMTKEEILTWKTLQYCLENNDFCENESKKTMQVIRYPHFYSKGKLWKSPFYADYKKAQSIRVLKKKAPQIIAEETKYYPTITSLLKPAETVAEYRDAMRRDFADPGKFQQMSTLNTAATAIKVKIVTASACFYPKYKIDENVDSKPMDHTTTMNGVIEEIKKCHTNVSSLASLALLYSKEFHLISICEATRVSLKNLSRQHYSFKRLINPQNTQKLTNRADVVIAFNHDHDNFIQSDWNYNKFTINTDSNELDKFETEYPIKYSWDDITNELAQGVTMLQLIDLTRKLKTITRYVKRHMKMKYSSNVYVYTLGNHSDTFLGCWSAVFGSLFKTGEYHTCVVSTTRLWSLSIIDPSLPNASIEEAKRAKIALNFIKALDNANPATFNKKMVQRIMKTYTIDGQTLESILRRARPHMHINEQYRNIGLFYHLDLLDDTEIDQMLNSPINPYVIWVRPQVKVDGIYQGAYQAVVYFHKYRMIITSKNDGILDNVRINFTRNSMSDLKFQVIYRNKQVQNWTQNNFEEVINRMFLAFLSDARLTNTISMYANPHTNTTTDRLRMFMNKYDKMWRYGTTAATVHGIQSQRELCNISFMGNKDERFWNQIKITAYWPKTIPLINTVYVTCQLNRAFTATTWSDVFAGAPASSAHMKILAQKVEGSLRPTKHYTVDDFSMIETQNPIYINYFEVKRIAQFTVDFKNVEMPTDEDFLIGLIPAQHDENPKLVIRHDYAKTRMVDINHSFGTDAVDELMTWLYNEGLLSEETYEDEIDLPLEQRHRFHYELSLVPVQYIINNFPNHEFLFSEPVFNPALGMQQRTQLRKQCWSLSVATLAICRLFQTFEIKPEQIFKLNHRATNILRIADRTVYDWISFTLRMSEFARRYLKLTWTNDLVPIQRFLSEIQQNKTMQPDGDTLASALKQISEHHIKSGFPTASMMRFRQNVIDVVSSLELDGQKVDTIDAEEFVRDNYVIRKNKKELKI